MIYDVTSPLYQSFLKVNIKRQVESDPKAKSNAQKGPTKVSKPVGAIHTGL